MRRAAAVASWKNRFATGQEPPRSVRDVKPQFYVVSVTTRVDRPSRPWSTWRSRLAVPATTPASWGSLSQARHGRSCTDHLIVTHLSGKSSRTWYFLCNSTLDRRSCPLSNICRCWNIRQRPGWHNSPADTRRGRGCSGPCRTPCDCASSTSFAVAASAARSDGDRVCQTGQGVVYCPRGSRRDEMARADGGRRV